MYWPGHWASPETIDFHALICTVCPQYLSLREVSDIIDQLSGEQWLKDRQILWSGIPFEEAQTYAKNHDMQTLTIAMGPLMDKGNPACLKSQKSVKEWSNYVRGASLIFSWRINTSGKITTLLVPPPPNRFNPSRRTSFQEIEEPVIKGLLSPRTVDRIMIAHPTVKEAGDLTYQYWPVDEQHNWIEQNGIEKEAGRKWRKVNGAKEKKLALNGQSLPQYMGNLSPAMMTVALLKRWFTRVWSARSYHH
ncbi:hypothetical protein ColLi_12378 [Colletotrichum liriopes]|uniref:Uncharacterized protein n=1 Tax=Colletotrichum liriopes TaxID=708192 RepID=A0AA37GYA6_9PEZI|nr:hypothetical protein ColLi_12378 [Colletotrichum liriopes]